MSDTAAHFEGRGRAGRGVTGFGGLADSSDRVSTRVRREVRAATLFLERKGSPDYPNLLRVLTGIAASVEGNRIDIHTERRVKELFQKLDGAKTASPLPEDREKELEILRKRIRA